MTAPVLTQPKPCNGGTYPLWVDGIPHQTCKCPQHWWRIHPGWHPPITDEPDR